MFFGRKQTSHFRSACRFNTSLLTEAQTFTCSNSSQILTSVCSGTTKVVSCAYLKRVFSLDIACKSVFITGYNTGPIPDPWTTLRPMLLVFDRRPLTLHCWLCPVKNEQIQFMTYAGKSKVLSFCTKIMWSTLSNALLKSISKHLT